MGKYWQALFNAAVAVALYGLFTATPPEPDFAHFSYSQAEKEVVCLVYDIGGGRAGATGTIVKGGYILTAKHVVTDMDTGEDNGMAVKAVTYDGREYKTVTVWRSEKHDLALLKITDPMDPADAALAPTLSTEGLSVGENIVMLGMPHLDPKWAFSWGKISSDKPGEYNDYTFTVVQIAGVAGSSGSPIFAPNGSIVAVLSIGYDAGFGAPTGFMGITTLGSDYGQIQNIINGAVSPS